MPTMKELRALRARAGVTLIEAAVAARVSENTTRLYEANPEAVSPKQRQRLDAFYDSLRARHAAEASP